MFQYFLIKFAIWILYHLYHSFSLMCFFFNFAPRQMTQSELLHPSIASASSCRLVIIRKEGTSTVSFLLPCLINTCIHISNAERWKRHKHARDIEKSCTASCTKSQNVVHREAQKANQALVALHKLKFYTPPLMLLLMMMMKLCDQDKKTNQS